MKVELTLKKSDEKKHSVIYRADTDAVDPIVTSVYVMKLAMMKAGATAYPATIKLTVEG